MPNLTEEQLRAAAEKRAETKKKKDEAEKAIEKLDEDQKNHLVTYLLKQNRERRLMVVEEVLETWAEKLTDDNLKYGFRQAKRADYSRRLLWVQDFFGTRFEREGQDRFRRAKLSKVVAELVKFSLSIGDREPGQEADLGVFTETADDKTIQALLALSQESDSVAIAETGYNKAQQLLRIISEQFGDQVLGDKKLKELVGEVQSSLKIYQKGIPVIPEIKAGAKALVKAEAEKRQKYVENEKKEAERKATEQVEK